MKQIVVFIAFSISFFLSLNAMEIEWSVIESACNRTTESIKQGTKIKSFEIISNYNGHSDTPILIDQADEWGDTRLHKAIEAKRADEVKELMQKGARFDISNKLGQTPLSLLLSNSNEESGLSVYESFKKLGCVKVNNLSSIKKLLDNNVAEFHNALEYDTFNESIPLKCAIEKLCHIFYAADLCKDSERAGYVVHQTEFIDYFIMMRMSDLQEYFNVLNIEHIRTLLQAYHKAQMVITWCENHRYQEAEAILIHYSIIAQDIRFNRYIMARLLDHRDSKCWDLLLKFNFQPTVTHKKHGTILHGVAECLNMPALSALILKGADVKVTNAAGQTTSVLLVAKFMQACVKNQDKICDNILDVLNSMRLALLQRSGEEDVSLANLLHLFIKQYTLKYG